MRIGINTIEVVININLIIAVTNVNFGVAVTGINLSVVVIVLILMLSLIYSLLFFKTYYVNSYGKGDVIMTITRKLAAISHASVGISSCFDYFSSPNSSGQRSVSLFITFFPHEKHALFLVYIFFS